MPVIGSMSFQPGESITLMMPFMIHGDTGGQPDHELLDVPNWAP